MGTTAWTRIVIKFYYTYITDFKCFRNDLFCNSLGPWVNLTISWDLLFDNFFDLCVDFIHLFFSIFYGSLILDIWRINKVVPLSSHPWILCLTQIILSLWTARSSICPAEWIFIWVSRRGPSILMFTFAPTGMFSASAGSLYQIFMAVQLQFQFLYRHFLPKYRTYFHRR